jgi:hypothetical protein
MSTTSRKTPPSRNPVAKALRQVKPKVVRSRRAYNRRPKHAKTATNEAAPPD